MTNNPTVRCKRWPNGLSKDTQIGKDTLKEIGEEKKVPEADKQPSVLELTNHLSMLETARDKLSDSLSAKAVGEADLNKATSSLIKVRKTIEAWKQMRTLYNPK